MKINNLKELLEEFGSNIRYEHDLKKKNWFNIGGKTKVFYKADNLKELLKFLKILDNKERIFILGAGSNMLISDKMFDGVVIKLSKNFNSLSLLGEDILIAGSAVLDKSVSDFAIENNLSGFEFLSCIPGTIGGGIRMNTGCFNYEIKDTLVSVQAVNFSGQVISILKKDINFNYRECNLPKDLVFLSATFKGEKKASTLIQKKIEELKEKKEIAQPTKIKTGGSTFKNPKGLSNKKVWELINSSVALNTKFGGASISSKHCNFLVNKNNATFNDMQKLIYHIKNEVKKKTGIEIQLEIVLVE